jgi:hypothetical protein
MNTPTLPDESLPETAPDDEPDDSRVLVIPEGLDFGALELSRDRRTGDLSFNWEPVEQICVASGLDLDALIEESEENLSELIQAWYEAHLAAGGAADPVQETLLREAEAEAARTSPQRDRR